METNKSCSFFAHKDTQATEELQQTIRETVEYLITQRQVDTFLLACVFYYKVAITSTSTSTFFGSVFTATQLRAGFVVKYSA